VEFIMALLVVDRKLDHVSSAHIHLSTNGLTKAYTTINTTAPTTRNGIQNW
jgi:hypothetical protein